MNPAEITVSRLLEEVDPDYRREQEQRRAEQLRGIVNARLEAARDAVMRER